MTERLNKTERQMTEIEQDGVILALWSQKLDTRDIASRLGWSEADVYNRLSRAREAARS